MASSAEKVAKILRMKQEEREANPNVFPVVGICDRMSANDGQGWLVWAGRNKKTYNGINLHRIKTIKALSIVITPTIEEARTLARKIAKQYKCIFVDVFEPTSKGFQKEVEPVEKKKAGYSTKDVLRIVLEEGYLDDNPKLKQMARNVV